MDFTSFVFLFSFWPFTVIFFLVAEKRFRLIILVILSLIFCFWSRSSTAIIIIGLTILNYVFGLWIDMWRQTLRARLVLFVGVAVNVAVLVLYKLFAAYGPVMFVGSFKKLLPLFAEKWLLNLVFPVGISYLVFQVISYLIDVYKNACPCEKNFLNFSIYIFFFPKLLSGPITLYRSFAPQLSKPVPDIRTVAMGLRRFALGLAKKVLIADHLSKVVNAAFGLETPNFGPGIAWLVLIGFALQLYFDFSGYIDMAIGLGQVVGFSLPENFNYPYISRNIGEFWRRWHMTLSAWFREYVFYPLERKRLPLFGQQVNILIVFLLTGLWHGLTLPYVIWGLIHGTAIALESAFLGQWLKRTWQPFQHAYTLAIILFSWIFFRSNDLQFAWLFLRRLSGDRSGITILPFSLTTPLPFLEPTFLIALAAGVIFSLPVSGWLAGLYEKIIARQPKLAFPVQVVSDGLTLVLLWASIAALASGSFAPGIYDKF